MKSKRREKVEVASVRFAGLADDEFPVGAFYGPLTPTGEGKGLVPAHVSDEFFAMIKACGIRLLVAPCEQYSIAKDSVLRAMDLSAKYGLGYFVMDRFTEDAMKGRAEFHKEDMKTLVNAVKDHPAFFGVHTKDEPRTNQFSVLAAINDSFYELGLEGKHTYANLLPEYHWEVNYTGVEENIPYEAYVDGYLKTVRPRYISYDHYLYEDAAEGGYRVNLPHYFDNLSVVRRKAEEYGIPFWAFVQAGGQWNDANRELPIKPPMITAGQFRWNVSTLLCYGAKGMQYFPLFEPYFFARSEGGKWDWRRNGLIGGDGTPNRWYAFAKEANAHIACVGSTLLRSKNEGVLLSGSAAEGPAAGKPEVLSDGYYELRAVEGNAIVGCFNREGRTVLYAVNYDTEAAGEVHLTFDGDYEYEVMQGVTCREERGETLTLSLAPGEGALVALR